MKHKKLKRVLSVFLCVMMALSLMACSSSAGTEQKAKFTPGTYTADAEGRNGLVKVEVTVDESKIVSVKVLEHSETPGISDAPIAQIPQKIVDGQTLAVDAVSGASFTSNAILAAVTSALEQAGANIEALKKANGEKKATAQDDEADIVVVGAGVSGMIAALEAANAGKEVILVDKLGVLGGADTMLISTFTRAVGTSIPAEKEAGNFTPEDLVKYNVGVITKGDSPYSETTLQTVAERSGEMVDWLVGLGVPFAKFNVKDLSWNTADGSAPGPHIVKALKEQLDAKNVDYRLSTKATKLIAENGAVTGVELESPEGNYKITAKAVILATGGFAANPELVQKYDSRWLNRPSTGSSAATGDGIIMASEIGADTYNMTEIKSNNLAYVTKSGAAVSLTALKNYIVLVNHDGKRFVDESHSSNNFKSLAMMEQEGHEAYAIFDQKAIDKLKLISDYNNQGYFASADTLEELAGKIDVDKEAFLKTMKDYQAYTKAGKDEEFGKKITESIDTGKFYAALVTPSLQTTHGGVKVDDQGRAISTEGQVIPGLYAAGSTSGHDAGTNATGGASIVNIVFGKVVGEAAVADLK